MAIMVIGTLHVRPGAERDFEKAMLERPRVSPPSSDLQAMYFVRAQDDPHVYRRISVWPSREAWQHAREQRGQDAFLAGLADLLEEGPTMELCDVVDQWPTAAEGIVTP